MANDQQIKAAEQAVADAKASGNTAQIAAAEKALADLRAGK